jgi:hypothetical protein
MHTLEKDNETQLDRSANSPSIVRASFLTYLRIAFPYSKDWKHPTTNHIYEHSLIEKRLKEFKELNPGGYRVLWYLWTSQGTRSFIADQMHCSGPTIKRRWDRSIDTVLLMLIFPDLMPSSFTLFCSFYE